MKKRIISLAIASVLVIGCVGLNPITVKAASPNAKYEGLADDSAPETVELQSGSSSSSTKTTTVDITGTVKKVVYSVDIYYGAMKFTYDYGMSWDPDRHMYYDASNPSRSIKKGWLVSDLADSDIDDPEIGNNEIRIVNNSNYPIRTSFSHQTRTGTFNSQPKSGTSVVGIFAKDSATLASYINPTPTFDSGYQAVTDYISDEKTANRVPAINITHSFDLDICSDYVSSQTGALYATLKNSGDFKYKNEYKQHVFFAYSGIPENGVTTNAVGGTITVSIAPVPVGDVDKSTAWN